ncbi:MAG: DUF373 family protein [Thermoplasmata archaeon]|nr:DUF373 family protein [Thermoplasmata archaeon]
MKRLVLCVDRDDDIGQKGGINTPLVGRDEVLDGALSLARADPEDSDVNTIFHAINTYDRLKARGEDVEVALVAGDVSLGARANEVLVTQLDAVLSLVKPDSVILVSDGADDENFYPMVASRVRIDGLQRVYVKQAPGVERTIHVFLNTMKEEKIQRKVLVPLGLAVLVYGVCALSGFASAGLGAIAITLGAYFLVKGYDLEEQVLAFYRDVQGGVATGGISIPFTFIAALLAVGGVVLGWGSIWESGTVPSLMAGVTSFFLMSIWWFMMAALVYGVGKVLDTYFRERKVLWGFFTYVFSLLALGFILTGVLHGLNLFLSYSSGGSLDVGVLKTSFSNLGIGIGVAILGAYFHHYLRDKLEKDREESPLPSEITPAPAGGPAPASQAEGKK